MRPRVAVHPRLFIWGPFEARLQQTDVMVLGSLNDGTWPEVADPGPWLNRPCAQTLGLPSPEEKIGYAAHDFTSFLGRAARLPHARAEDRRRADGALALADAAQALLAGLELEDALRTDEPWLGWARARDSFEARQRLKAPEPRPPLALRPRKMSVTRVETWLANPYAIFARDILRLDEAARALGASPDAALRGSIVHEIMSRFAQALSRRRCPPIPTAELIAIAARRARALCEQPARRRVLACRASSASPHWFAETEPARRARRDAASPPRSTASLPSPAPPAPSR